MRTTNNLRRLTLLLAAALAVVPAIADAQDAAGPIPRRLRPWTISPYLGISRHSPVGHRWGMTPDRHHLIVGLHATFPILQGHRWTLAYAPEAIPLIVVSNNPNYQALPHPNGGTVTIEHGRSNVAGAGIAPVALELEFDASRRVGIYAGGTMGGLWFTRRVPDVDARSFNFTFDFGGGVRLQMSDRTWLRMGYKFHHLSNANTAPSNPGVDAMVFLLGLERSFGGGM
jgi:hypothetical protein